MWKIRSHELIKRCLPELPWFVVVQQPIDNSDTHIPSNGTIFCVLSSMKSHRDFGNVHISVCAKNVSSFENLMTIPFRCSSLLILRRMTSCKKNRSLFCCGKKRRRKILYIHWSGLIFGKNYLEICNKKLEHSKIQIICTCTWFLNVILNFWLIWIDEPVSMMFKWKLSRFRFTRQFIQRKNEKLSVPISNAICLIFSQYVLYHQKPTNNKWENENRWKRIEILIERMLLTKSSHFTQICFIFTFHSIFCLSVTLSPSIQHHFADLHLDTSHFSHISCLFHISKQTSVCSSPYNMNKTYTRKIKRWHNMNKQISTLHYIEEQQNACSVTEWVNESLSMG